MLAPGGGQRLLSELGYGQCPTLGPAYLSRVQHTLNYQLDNALSLEGEQLLNLTRRQFPAGGLPLGFEVNRRAVQHRPVSVEVFHEFGNPAGVFELVGLVGSFVGDGDDHTLVQKGQFAQTLRQGVEVKV